MRYILFALCLVLGFVSTPVFAESSVAPDFTLRDINKKKVSLSDYKGKVVLLNFWATWCQPCQAEMPHLEAIYKDLKEEGFEVLSISIDEARDASKVKPLIKRGKYTFTVLLDKQTKVIPLYHPEQTLPYNALIDREGNLVWTKLSYAPGEEKLLREKVEELLKTGKVTSEPKVAPVPAPKVESEEPDSQREEP
ncbi:MAG: TlpA disulfide reductase family protein [Myxococcota bacterium]|nr:TlpA disulfide reductase family protein [Myxococcota bacterium]